MSQVKPIDVRARGARRRPWIVGVLVGAGVGFVVLLGHEDVTCPDVTRATTDTTVLC